MIIKKNFFLYIFIIWYTVDILTSISSEKILGVPLFKIDRVMSIVVLVFLILQIVFFQKYEIAEIILISFISILVLVVTIKSNSNYLLTLILFVIASKESDIDSLISISYRILLFCLVIIVLLSIINAIPDIQFIRKNIVRHSLGFSHPNILGMRVFQCLVLHVYLNRRRYIHCVIISIPTLLFVYHVPNSQSPTILIALLIIGVGLIGFLERYNKVHKLMICLIVAAIVVNLLSIIGCLINVGKYPQLKEIDKLLSYRFSMSHIVYSIYGIKLFGQPVYLTTNERIAVGLTGHLYLDNAYMSMLIKYGVVGYGIFSILFILTMMFLYKKEQYILLFCFFIYAIYGIMEPAMYRLTYNTLLIFIGSFVFSKDFREHERKDRIRICFSKK